MVITGRPIHCPAFSQGSKGKKDTNICVAVERSGLVAVLVETEIQNHVENENYQAGEWLFLETRGTYIPRRCYEICEHDIERQDGILQCPELLHVPCLLLILQLLLGLSKALVKERPDARPRPVGDRDERDDESGPR